MKTCAVGSASRIFPCPSSPQALVCAGERGHATVAPASAALTHIFVPEETNPSGNVHGGSILKHVELAGWLAAARHCATPGTRLPDVYMWDVCSVRGTRNTRGAVPLSELDA